MTNRPALKVAMALLASLTLTLASAEEASTPPRVDPVEDAARTALATKDYRTVVDLYTPHIGGDRLTALGHYRYAIAAKNLGLFPEADSNLKKAISIAPSGDFASDPSRLQSLQAQIAEGCSTTPCEGSFPVALASEQPTPDGSQAATQQTAIATSEAPEVVPTAPTTAPVSQDAQTSNRAPRTQEVPRGAGGMQYGLIATLVSAASIFFIFCFVLIKRTSKAHSTSNERAFTELKALGAQLTKVIGYIEAADMHSSLHLRLVELEELIALEVGRQHYRQAGQAHSLTESDRAQLAVFLNLQSDPPDARVATPDEIEAAFRSARRCQVFNRSLEGEQANV